MTMTHLTEGKKAPAFKSKDQNGMPVSLADFKGKKSIGVYPMNRVKLELLTAMFEIP